MKFIFEFQRLFNLKFEIACVIVDRESDALNFAKANNLNNHFIKYNRSKKSDDKMSLIIDSYDPDIIITNFHKIISNRLLNRFGNKFINLHYSFLPAYAGHIGMKSVDLAIENKSKFIGVTSHFLIRRSWHGWDNHPRDFPVDKNELYKSVFDCGALVLLSTIFKNLNYKMGSVFRYNDMIINPFPKQITESHIISIFDIFNKKHGS